MQLETAQSPETVLPMIEDLHRLEGFDWVQQKSAAALARLMASPELGHVGVLRENGAVCGYFILTWSFDLEWSGREAFLTDLYLRPEARGKGLGAAALALIEQAARDHGARVVHLMVRHENDVARKLYARAGYESPPRVFLSKPLA